MNIRENIESIINLTNNAFNYLSESIIHLNKINLENKKKAEYIKQQIGELKVIANHLLKELIKIGKISDLFDIEKLFEKDDCKFIQMKKLCYNIGTNLTNLISHIKDTPTNNQTNYKTVLSKLTLAFDQMRRINNDVNIDENAILIELSRIKSIEEELEKIKKDIQ